MKSPRHLRRTIDLTRRAATVDSPAATMLVPYAGWVAFVTALNAAIARRNPGRTPEHNPEGLA